MVPPDGGAGRPWWRARRHLAALSPAPGRSAARRARGRTAGPCRNIAGRARRPGRQRRGPPSPPPPRRVRRAAPCQDPVALLAAGYVRARPSPGDPPRLELEDDGGPVPTAGPVVVRDPHHGRHLRLPALVH